MRNHLIWIPASIIIFATAIIKPASEMMRPAKVVNKTISFDMFKAKSYKSGIYDYTTAQVFIVVEKVSNKKRTIVWQKAFDAQLLKQYPSVNQAKSEQITVHGILDNKEHLEVNYILTYDTKGSMFQLQSGIFSVDANDTVKISI